METSWIVAMIISHIILMWIIYSLWQDIEYKRDIILRLCSTQDKLKKQLKEKKDDKG